MDHKQSATPFGRRKGLLYPNRNNCPLIERHWKPRLKKWLCCAPDVGAGLSQHNFQKSPYAPLFSRIAFVLAPRETTTFAPLFLHLDLAGNLGSSSCRCGPRFTLLRPQPADDDTQLGFSEAGDPPLRNLRSADALRESVKRVKSHPRSLNKLACYSRHMRGRGRRPLDLAVFKSNPRFLDPSHWHSRTRRRQSALAYLSMRHGQGRRGQCFSEAVEPLRCNLRGVHTPRGRVNRVPVKSTRSY
jgi:hypothetical protein